MKFFGGVSAGVLPADRMRKEWPKALAGATNAFLQPIRTVGALQDLPGSGVLRQIRREVLVF